MSDKTGQAGGISKLMAKLSEQAEERKKFEETSLERQAKTDETIQLILTELRELRTSSPKRAASGGSKAANSTATGAKEKFPNNSLLWFKKEFLSNKDSLLALFTPTQLSQLEEYKGSAEDYKSKEGDAAKLEEVKFLWTTFVQKTDLKDKVRQLYERKKSEYNESNKTPASKEGDSN